jgi:serine/threonine protein kinase
LSTQTTNETVASEAGQARETLLKGKWRLGERLGGGGQAETFLARAGNHTAVAKRFVLPGQSDWKPFDLFEREVRVLRALQHPRIPRFIDAFEHTPGTFYLLMDYVPGASLDSDRGRLGHRQLVQIVSEVCSILRYLHALYPPVIHRDIKPANLVRDQRGAIHLVDFGGVRETFRAEGGSTVVGTFGYMAPEQLYGQALPATDLYALGMTVASLATGLEPEQIPRRGLRLELGPLFPIQSAKLIALIEGLTEADPERRFQSAQQVLDYILEHQLMAPRTASAAPALAIAVTLTHAGRQTFGRTLHLEPSGCLIDVEWPHDDAVELQVTIGLLIDEVELDGIEPLVIRGRAQGQGGNTCVDFGQLTRFEKRWLRGAQLYAQLKRI